ncbi:transposase (plasmid) [Azospirillum argentinense]|uniref:Transposase n=1 Tax=Azospirillum argentinense TaxID=2970906 RepID=A0A4D8PTV5_9PROT|nr:transposase [Azospirillum argentinense]QCO00228.1 transposase [Azospirillum argentinense]
MQRVEIITGKERRRRWSEAEKARLVAETLEPGAIVAHVARRHGVAESCLYTWRRHLVGEMADRLPPDDAPLLIPVSNHLPPTDRGSNRKVQDRPARLLPTLARQR